MFFHPNQPFNQGKFSTFNEDEFINACEITIQKYLTNPVNEAGFNLQKEFSWENTVNILLNNAKL